VIPESSTMIPKSSTGVSESTDSSGPADAVAIPGTPKFFGDIPKFSGDIPNFSGDIPKSSVSLKSLTDIPESSSSDVPKSSNDVFKPPAPVSGSLTHALPAPSLDNGGSDGTSSPPILLSVSSVSSSDISLSTNTTMANHHAPVTNDTNDTSRSDNCNTVPDRSDTLVSGLEGKICELAEQMKDSQITKTLLESPSSPSLSDSCSSPVLSGDKDSNSNLPNPAPLVSDKSELFLKTADINQILVDTIHGQNQIATPTGIGAKSKKRKKVVQSVRQVGVLL